MRIRHRLKTWTGAAALAACGVCAAAAQAQDAVQRCRQAADDHARIACLEAALRDQPAPAAENPETERRGFLPRLFGGDEDRQAAPVEAPTPAARELGAEQVAARAAARSSEPSERLAARVADAQTIPFRRLQVTLDNGQVWRQIEGDTQRISVRDGADLSVEIWEARVGGYRMRLNEIARTIRVERIR